MPLVLTKSPSPITTDIVALSGVSFTELRPGNDGSSIVYACSDPAKGGRSQVYRVDADGGGEPTCLTGENYNVRSAVHEYGGGAFAVIPSDAGGGLVYTDFPSHKVFRTFDNDDKNGGPRGPIQVYPAVGRESDRKSVV